MTTRKLMPTSPGEMLLEEFLKPMGITAYRLAKSLGVPQTRISAILHNQRSITPETAIRLSCFFGNTAEFWVNLQNSYDLKMAKLTLEKSIRKEVHIFKPSDKSSHKHHNTHETGHAG